LNGISFDENASQPANEFLFKMMEVNEEIDDSNNLAELEGNYCSARNIY